MFRPMCMPAPAGVHLGPAGGGCRVVRLVHAGQLEAPLLVRSPGAGGVRILRDMATLDRPYYTLETAYLVPQRVWDKQNLSYIPASEEVTDVLCCILKITGK